MEQYREWTVRHGANKDPRMASIQDEGDDQ